MATGNNGSLAGAGPAQSAQPGMGMMGGPPSGGPMGQQASMYGRSGAFGGMQGMSGGGQQSAPPGWNNPFSSGPQISSGRSPTAGLQQMFGMQRSGGGGYAQPGMGGNQWQPGQTMYDSYGRNRGTYQAPQQNPYVNNSTMQMPGPNYTPAIAANNPNIIPAAQGWAQSMNNRFAAQGGAAGNPPIGPRDPVTGLLPGQTPGGMLVGPGGSQSTTGIAPRDYGALAAQGAAAMPQASVPQLPAYMQQAADAYRAAQTAQAAPPPAVAQPAPQVSSTDYSFLGKPLPISQTAQDIVAFNQQQQPAAPAPAPQTATDYSWIGKPLPISPVAQQIVAYNQQAAQPAAPAAQPANNYSWIGQPLPISQTAQDIMARLGWRP